MLTVKSQNLTNLSAVPDMKPVSMCVCVLCMCVCVNACVLVFVCMCVNACVLVRVYHVSFLPHHNHSLCLF